jgi:transposase
MAFQPPYSPELNADEQVWSYAKREIGKRIIRSKDEMEKVILSIMSTIKKCAQLIRSSFRMPDTEYASLDFGII